MKTAVQIERDFYTIISQSQLGKELKGKVYRKEMRPIGSQEEDLILSLLSGVDEQVQTGVVAVSIYVKDMPFESRFVRNTERIGELLELVNSITENYSFGYVISTDGTPSIIQLEDISQHVISIRLYFEYLNLD